DVGCVVYGAPFGMSSARQKVRVGRTFTLTAGEELHIGGTAVGMRAYLCVVGGFRCDEILGSRSALGAVRRGGTLEWEASRMRAGFIEPPLAVVRDELDCLPGLQADWFADDGFYDAEYVVSPALDRMGVRLKGTPLTLPERELVSEPVAPGAVQV